jgi:hypothetical protein
MFSPLSSVSAIHYCTQHTGASLAFQGTSFGMSDFIKQGTIYYAYSQTGDVKKSTENTIRLNSVLSRRFQKVSHIF